MIKLKTAPATDVAVALDVRTFLRMSSSAADATLLELAQAARQYAEDFTRRAFITQTWQKALDYKDVKDAIWLPRPPLRSIVSITTYNDIGAATVQDAASYTMDTFSEPGWVELLTGYTWGYIRELNGMLIEYTAGYGAASAVPLPIKRAIIELAAYWFSEPASMGTIPPMTEKKLRPYIVYLP
jgi:uncharacterized phiE125 gp8 family phage protein